VAHDKIPPFNAQQLESIAKVLADRYEGLTGTQIEYLLQDCRIPDVSPEMTKWKRLFNAFAKIQDERQIGNFVVMFILRAMDPVQYTAEPQRFRRRQDQLNAILAFSGMNLGDDGKMHRGKRAENLDEALRRASRLHGALVARAVHKDVLESCRAELLQENYFHAVFEAVKSIAAKIRSLSGLTNDGAALVTEAFTLSGNGPIIAINPLSSDTDKGEQRGFANLLIGLFGTIRNPLAHNSKIEWPMSEQDALDILTMASLVHRKLDNGRRLR
jgi:uncharacterized protein (TIGR02391 family)